MSAGRAGREPRIAAGMEVEVARGQHLTPWAATPSAALRERGSWLPSASLDGDGRLASEWMLGNQERTVWRRSDPTVTDGKHQTVQQPEAAAVKAGTGFESPC